MKPSIDDVRTVDALMDEMDRDQIVEPYSGRATSSLTRILDEWEVFMRLIVRFDKALAQPSPPKRIGRCCRRRTWWGRARIGCPSGCTTSARLSLAIVAKGGATRDPKLEVVANRIQIGEGPVGVAP
jgi:hypothetical protein